jgi:hypothetical protein
MYSDCVGGSILKNKYILAICVTSLLLLTIFTQTILAASTNSNLIDVHSQSNESSKLFDIQQFKPGDWANRELILSNAKNHPLQYSIDFSFLDGSRKFYDNLVLEIKQKGNILYSGSLASFQLIKDLDLEANETIPLRVEIRFPKESGNEYQGLTANASIIITAVDHTTEEEISFGMTTESDSHLLPNTATTMFSWMIVGIIILFSGIFLYLFYQIQKRSKI